MQSVNKQIETNAIATYCALRNHGTTHAHAARATVVPLSSAARSSNARALRARTAQGLAELVVQQAFVPLPFINGTTNHLELLYSRTLARNAQAAREYAE